MDNQNFFIILIGISIVAVILFSLDIYYLAKKNKRLKDNKRNISLNFSDSFLSDLEKIIQGEIKQTVSNINKELIKEIIESYKKELINFSQKAEEKATALEDTARKEIMKFNDIYDESKSLVLKEINNKMDGLNKDLDEKLNYIYETAAKAISEKIVQTEKHINDYKQEKIEEIDEKIYQIIEKIANKTIGKTIDTSTHEDLVFDALEKAKKEIF